MSASGPAFRTTGQPYETAELRRMVRENKQQAQQIQQLHRLLVECNKQLDSIRVRVASPRRVSPVRVSPIRIRTPAPKKTPKKTKYTFTPRTVGIHTPKYYVTPRRRKPAQVRTPSPQKVRTPSPPKVKTPSPPRRRSIFDSILF